MSTVVTSRSTDGQVTRLTTFARDLLGQIDSVISDPQVARYEELIDAEALDVEHGLRESYVSNVNKARAKADKVGQRLAEARDSLFAALAERASMIQGQIALCALWFIAGLICVGTEFAITVTTLPSLMGINRYDFTGILLGLSPAAAFIVLDVVFDRLFETPYHRIRSGAPMSKWGRRTAVAWTGVFLISVAALNLATVWALADAREDIVKIHQDFRANGLETTETADSDSVNRAILFLSVAMAVDGAIFTLFAFYELRLLLRWRRIGRREHRLERARADLEDQNAEAVAELATAQSMYGERDVLARDLASRHRQELLARLHQTQEDAWLKQSAVQMVDQHVRSRSVLNRATSEVAGQSTVN